VAESLSVYSYIVKHEHFNRGKTNLWRRPYKVHAVPTANVLLQIPESLYPKLVIWLFIKSQSPAISEKFFKFLR